jgi:hypothetical protein
MVSSFSIFHCSPLSLHPSSTLLLFFCSFSVENGHIKRITDPHIQTSVIEVIGTNVATCYITCPADPAKTLGIKLPFLVMIIKNVLFLHREWFS